MGEGHGWRARGAALLLGHALLFAMARGAQAQDAAEGAVPASLESSVAVDTDDLWIVELRLRGRQRLAVDMLAFGNGAGQRLFVPLAETVEALGFVVEADQPVAGWFLRETQRFSFDPATGAGSVAGREVVLPAQHVAVEDGEVYVPLSALSDWFQLGATWSRDQQVITLEPPYLLSFEEAGQRGALRPGANGPLLDIGALPRAPSRYRLLSWPHATTTLSLSSVPGLEGRSDLVTQGSTLLRGDLLAMSGELFVSGSSQGNAQARIRLGRVDPDRGLLGPLRASSIEFGDIALSPAPLLQRAGSGVGVRLAREPLDATGDFDRTVVEGLALVGWQAELYRDGELLGFQTVADDGRYLFTDVPLLFGRNRFSVELYGPQGQRRTQTIVRDIDSTLIRPGALDYAVEFIDAGRFALSGRPDILAGRRAPPAPGIAPGSDLSSDPGTDAPNTSPALSLNTGQRAQAVARLGLSAALSVRAVGSWQQNPDASDPDVFLAGGGLTAALPKMFGRALLSADGLVDGEGDSAGRLGLVGGFRGLTLSTDYERFGQGFSSDANSLSGVDIAQRLSLRADGRVPLSEAFDIGFGMSGARIDRRDGGRNTQAALRLSSRVGPVSAAHTTTWQRTRIAEQDGSDRVAGVGTLSGRLGPIRLRAAVDYELEPDPLVRRGGLDASARMANWTTNLRVQHDFRSRAYDVQAGASRDWHGLRLGAEVRHNTRANDYQALATLSFDLDRDPVSRRPRLGRAAESARGTAQVRVFEDLDGDGLRGKDEPLVAADRIKAEPRGQIKALPDGSVLLSNLPTNQFAGVAVDGAVLNNPFAIPATPGAAIQPRAGALLQVDLPVVESVEIEAVLLRSDDSPVSNAIVDLLRCDGELQTRARTAFDGVAIFDLQPAGCYRLQRGQRVSEEFQLRSGDTLSQTLRED